jgi:GPH family glycoside/pentoside/hexuronide:cation symporter
MGIAIGGALAGWLLTFYGYQADVEQSDATKQGLLLSFTVLPALGSFAVAWVMRKYTLTEKKVISIQSELNTVTS